MLDKIKTFIENAASRAAFDPSVFNDSVAEKTEWTPLKRGGTNFRTHSLTEIDYNRLQYKISPGMMIFSLVFTAIGVGAAWLINSQLAIQYSGFSFDSHWPILLFGGIFTTAGLGMLYSGSKPIVFDKISGFYWKGRKEPNISVREEELKNACRLSSIYAIQILRERVRSNKSTYYSYEINLVKKDGSRLNVIDHGKKAVILEDAKKLSEFLGKPVWDAS
jgi:hypothetical protein